MAFSSPFGPVGFTGPAGTSVNPQDDPGEPVGAHSFPASVAPVVRSSPISPDNAVLGRLNGKTFIVQSIAIANYHYVNHNYVICSGRRDCPYCVTYETLKNDNHSLCDRYKQMKFSDCVFESNGEGLRFPRLPATIGVACDNLVEHFNIPADKKIRIKFIVEMEGDFPNYCNSYFIYNEYKHRIGSLLSKFFDDCEPDSISEINPRHLDLDID